MKVITSTVVDGKIQVPDGVLAEGESVTILARDADEPIRLTAEQEAELSVAADEIHGGDSVDGDDLVAELKALIAD